MPTRPSGALLALLLTTALSTWPVAAAMAQATNPNAGVLEAGASESDEPTPTPLPAAEPPAISETAALNDPVGAITSVVCPFKEAIDYEPGDIECGFTMVPENRERPDSRMVRLHFVKIAAHSGKNGDDADDSASDGADASESAPDAEAANDTSASNDDSRRSDPVVYLTGGPGVGVEPYVERFYDHDLVKTRDLYILEQRGIGPSGEFCPFYEDIDRPTTMAESTFDEEERQAERMRTCFAGARARGVDLSGYNTVENARDVRALRRALGFEQWNVWGISYGSHLGQMLTQVDPEGIRALVIDAIVPNDLGELQRSLRWLDRDLELIFSQCTDHPACDGLEERLFETFQAVADERLVVELDDTELYPAGRASLGPAALVYAPFSMMYEQDEHPALIAVMTALLDIVEDGNEDLLKPFFLGRGDGVGLSEGMAYALRCNDGYFHAQAEVAAEELEAHPRYGTGIFTVEGTRLLAETCEQAGLAPRDRRAYQLVQTDIPTLIVNGTWDPITPPPLAERILPGFANGRYIEVPFAGHGPTRSMSECSGKVLNAFFDDPTAEVDARCLEEGVEPPEYLRYHRSTALLQAASVFLEEPKQLLVPGIWAGTSLAVLAIAVFAVPLGFLARLVDRQRARGLKATSGGARLMAFLAAASAVGGVAVLSYGGYEAYELSELSLIAGFAPPGWVGAWLLVASGAFGILTLLLLIKRLGTGALRIGSLIGLALTGLAAIAFSLFAIVWNLTPSM